MSDKTVRGFKFDAKIVLVTGGGSGICLAFVKQALDRGAKAIIIADLTLTPDAQTLLESSRDRVVFQETNVADWKQLKALFETSLQKFHDVPDVVCNGAGIFEPAWSNFWDDTEEERYASVDINLSAVIKLTRMAM